MSNQIIVERPDIHEKVVESVMPWTLGLPAVREAEVVQQIQATADESRTILRVKLHGEWSCTDYNRVLGGNEGLKALKRQLPHHLYIEFIPDAFDASQDGNIPGISHPTNTEMPRTWKDLSCRGRLSQSHMLHKHLADVVAIACTEVRTDCEQVDTLFVEDRDAFHLACSDALAAYDGPETYFRKIGQYRRLHTSFQDQIWLGTDKVELARYQMLMQGRLRKVNRKRWHTGECIVFENRRHMAEVLPFEDAASAQILRGMFLHRGFPIHRTAF